MMRIPKGLQTAITIASVTGVLLIVTAVAAAAWYYNFPDLINLAGIAGLAPAGSSAGGQSRMESILTPETPKPSSPTPKVEEPLPLEDTSTPTATITPDGTTTITTTPNLTSTGTTTPSASPSSTSPAFSTSTKTNSGTDFKPSATPKPSKTPAKTSTPKPTSTSKPTATHTPRPGTPTNTPIPPTASNTPTPSRTPSATATPSVTNTPRPSATPTQTFTPRPATATPQGPTLTPTVDLSGCVYATHSSYESELIALINDVRRQNGLSALSMNWNLRLAAREHSVDMVCNQQYSHTGSNGSTNYDRIIAHGYYPTWWGENFYVGWQTTPQDAFNWWMNSEPHRNNILSPYYVHIGIGHGFYDNRNGYTLVFGAN